MPTPEQQEFTREQWELARLQDICPVIQLEDPNCNIEFPSDLALGANEPSVFFLSFEDRAPTGYVNMARSLRLDYVPVNENGDARCWLLRAGADAIMRSDPTAVWPVNFHGNSGIKCYWSVDGQTVLENVQFTEYASLKQTEKPVIEPQCAAAIISHVSRMETRQDVLARRKEALAHKESQQMLAKIEGVANLLHNIVDNAHQTTTKIQALEKKQDVFGEVVADLQRRVQQLQQAPSPSTATAQEPEWWDSESPGASADGTKPTTTVTVGGYEVALERLGAPVAIYWWVNGQSYKRWMPRQRAVFELDKQCFTVDLQSSPNAQEPEHRGIPVRFLSFQNNDGSPKKRHRSRW